MPWPRLLLHVAVVAAGTVAGHRASKPLAAVAPFYDRAAKQDGVPASVQLRSCLTYTEGCAWTARRRPSHTEAPPGRPQPAGASVPVVVGPAGQLSALQTLQLPSRLGVCPPPPPPHAAPVTHTAGRVRLPRRGRERGQQGVGDGRRLHRLLLLLRQRGGGGAAGAPARRLRQRVAPGRLEGDAGRGVRHRLLRARGRQGQRQHGQRLLQAPPRPSAVPRAPSIPTTRPLPLARPVAMARV